MKANETIEQDLDNLFAEMRGSNSAPSLALMDRVLADAIAEQQKPISRNTVKAPRPHWLDRLATMFGGGGALAGISLSLAAGVFIGLARPAPVASLANALMADTQMDNFDLFPGATALWEEETYD